MTSAFSDSKTEVANARLGLLFQRVVQSMPGTLSGAEEVLVG